MEEEEIELSGHAYRVCTLQVTCKDERGEPTSVALTGGSDCCQRDGKAWAKWRETFKYVSNTKVG